MANLIPQNSLDDVYQLEINDPVLAGPGGIDNRQAQQLLNRTVYILDQLSEKSDQTTMDNVIDQLNLKADQSGVDTALALKADQTALDLKLNQSDYNSDFASQLQILAGYQILPSGLVIQWGSASWSGTGTERTFNYPIVFPNDLLNLQITERVPSFSTDGFRSLRDVTTSGFSSSFRLRREGNTGFSNFYFLALGY